MTCQAEVCVRKQREVKQGPQEKRDGGCQLIMVSSNLVPTITAEHCRTVHQICKHQHNHRRCVEKRLPQTLMLWTGSRHDDTSPKDPKATSRADLCPAIPMDVQSIPPEPLTGLNRLQEEHTKEGATGLAASRLLQSVKPQPAACLASAGLC